MDFINEQNLFELDLMIILYDLGVDSDLIGY